MLPLLSLYVGVLMSSDPSLACTHPPCRESLVAAPIPPGTGAVVGSGACDGPTGATTCRIGFSLPAISDDPRKVEHRHDKVSDITHSVTCCTIWTLLEILHLTSYFLATWKWSSEYWVTRANSVSVHKCPPIKLCTILSGAGHQLYSHGIVGTLNLAQHNSHDGSDSRQWKKG